MNAPQKYPLVMPEDETILARTIAGEAGNQTFDGKLAIAHVVVNRWRRKDGQFRMDTSIAATCLRYKQFSCWNPGDPNLPRITRLQTTDVQFNASLRAARLAIGLGSVDPTGGATHYHTKEKPPGAETWPPEWAVGHTPSAEVGAHVFYNDIR